jgi:hypothetical protein
MRVAMLNAERMTNVTLEANIKLYRSNWETIADAQRYIELLEEYIKRLERLI